MGQPETMMMSNDERVACRTPVETKDCATRIPAWKFKAVRRAILHAVDDAGPEGLLVGSLCSAVRQRLSSDDLARLGALGWHVMTVKLEMEVSGDIVHNDGRGPQRLRRA